MYVQSLELENFRNYKNLNICFDIGTNILYGNNAQGKTNIMEAIYVCGTSKSHRSSKDKEMIRFGADDAHIKMVVMKREVPIRIDMHLRKNKTKGIAINGIPIKKVSELFGVINVVFFSPEDLSIIKNGPSDRRRFIDLELCQLDKVYVHNLMNYNKIINQRNQLLKDLNYYYDSDLYNTLDIWDMQLAEYSKKIISRRSEFIEELNEIIYGIHRNITNGKEELYIKYEPNIFENDIYEELKKNRDRDIKYKTTSIGPHRDDICFYNKDIDIRKYGSQGQQRTAALSLKLSEIELVKNVIKDMPILLLDDVLSELDSSRQSHLLNSLHNVQTIITCTGLDEFVQNRFNIDNIYKIVEGTVERSNNE